MIKSLSVNTSVGKEKRAVHPDLRTCTELLTWITEESDVSGAGCFNTATSFSKSVFKKVITILRFYKYTCFYDKEATIITSPAHLDFIFCIVAICFFANFIRSSFDSVSNCEETEEHKTSPKWWNASWVWFPSQEHRETCLAVIVRSDAQGSGFWTPLTFTVRIITAETPCVPQRTDITRHKDINLKRAVCFGEVFQIWLLLHF